jgi:hypothetical protein
MDILPDSRMKATQPLPGTDGCGEAMMGEITPAFGFT